MFFRLRKTAHPVAEAEKTERSAAPVSATAPAAPLGLRPPLRRHLGAQHPLPRTKPRPSNSPPSHQHATPTTVQDEQLLAASKKGDREAAVAALRRGAPPNCKHPATGASPLHYAAAAGSITVMVLLLEHGAKVNARDHEDARPLHWAARAGQAAVVRAMCANLAVCLDCRNCSGEAALHWAVKVGKALLVLLVLRQWCCWCCLAGGGGGGDGAILLLLLLLLLQVVLPLLPLPLLVLPCIRGRAAALHNRPLVCCSVPACLQAGNIQAAVALVECGASLASTDKQRRTPLHLAAGNPAMCAVLGLAAQEHALQLRKGAVVGPDLYPVLITVVR